MAGFLLRRAAGIIVTLLVTSFLVFGSVHLAPGDPASFLLGGRSASPAAVAAIKEQYHLNDPFLVQYTKWIGGIVTGDFGKSVQFRQDVGGLIGARLPTTLWLIGYAGLLILIGGVAIGALAALRRGTVDRVVLIGTGVATATPSFVAAIGLISLFSVQLGWFPAFGNGSGFGDRINHLTLPAAALALTFIGLLARVTRTSMLAELGREHVEVARSRGVPGSDVVRRHVLRNALVPITTVTGTIVAGLLVATSIVETAFGLSGVGQLLVGSVTVKDFPVVQAISLMVVLAFVCANLIVDLIHPLIDPRLSHAKGGTR
ncbi:ABC transporter permease [Streptosporangium sp. NBC_01755]|uniref:ABC transporter permease n=1 Tax=unclassified Streptosporangium TaxID=2632669 RepID=UPI002DD91484|nr:MULTISPECIES: ABC transporter permease [unclassified Streptosporangium]WSA27994.1 ABC transporter permease [Streptosporangium sp. NBC_01810]WSD00535.1 ABC transporter permease [Streptosporangium sp. NBC_01755]